MAQTIISETSLIKFEGTGTGSFLSFDRTYNNLWLTGSINFLYISGSNNFNTLQINEGIEFKPEASITTGVNNLIASGSSGNLITMTGASEWVGWSISSPSGNIYCNYLDLSHSTATGGADFFAGINSNNNGYNRGWLWPGLTITEAFSSVEGDRFFDLPDLWWDSLTWDSTGETYALTSTFIVNNVNVSSVSSVSWSSSSAADVSVNSSGLCTKLKYYSYGSSHPIKISVWSNDNPAYSATATIDHNYPS